MKNTTWIIGGLLIAGIGAWTLSEAQQKKQEKPSIPRASAPKQLPAPAAGVNYAAMVSHSLAEAVEKTLPSVVVIKAKEESHYYRDYFGRTFVDRGNTGQGSGFFIREDGYIMSNNHVVRGADELTVVLDNGKEYNAKLVGRHPKTDVAVLKIEPEDKETFPVAELADSSKIRVGELVLAIGSPFSLSSTVTQGIISHKGRPSEYLPLVDVIQTSAPINPGNSGGPLVDVNGRIIGMNTYIQTAQPGIGGNIGIGFAVPSNVAVRIAELIIEGKKAELPWVGIVMEDTRYGVYITHVVQNGPADKAGVQKGDFIKSMDGKDVRTADDLRSFVLLRKPGQKIDTVLIRAEKEIKLNIVTETMPDLKTLEYE